MALRKHFEDLLAKREPPKTFCPSEVARALSEDELSELGYEGWRDAMEDVRGMAEEWRKEGRCEVLQKGEMVEGPIGEMKGPIRLRRIDHGG
ncbi:uncharacterized protein LTR77_008793 [Saxophila tyrrhenica]|uniref:Uncharacterized protein n=1 Tax=Saxophila tyrrhenica TaxID=1690608 RepID=A0AAV9P269_9PEZI|nr:hypothetical protein LTR77_008793 [Saxophila tyrrhenica]